MVVEGSRTGRLEWEANGFFFLVVLGEMDDVLSSIDDLSRSKETVCHHQRDRRAGLECVV